VTQLAHVHIPNSRSQRLHRFEAVCRLELTTQLSLGQDHGGRRSGAGTNSMSRNNVPLEPRSRPRGLRWIALCAVHLVCHNAITSVSGEAFAGVQTPLPATALRLYTVGGSGPSVPAVYNGSVGLPPGGGSGITLPLDRRSWYDTHIAHINNSHDTHYVITPPSLSLSDSLSALALIVSPSRHLRQGHVYGSVYPNVQPSWGVCLRVWRDCLQYCVHKVTSAIQCNRPTLALAHALTSLSFSHLSWQGALPDNTKSHLHTN
jgi:hypothetical protein